MSEVISFPTIPDHCSTCDKEVVFGATINIDKKEKLVCLSCLEPMATRYVEVLKQKGLYYEEKQISE